MGNNVNLQIGHRSLNQSPISSKKGFNFLNEEYLAVLGTRVHL